MRWTGRILLIVGILLVAHTAWPFWTLYQLGDAVERADVARIEELIDFSSVRRMIASQIIERYMTVTGQAAGLGPLGAVAANVGAGIAEPEVAKIVTAQGLIDLLRGKVAGVDVPSATATGVAPTQVRLGEVLRVWLDSDYGARRVIFFLPPNTPHRQQYGLRLERDGLTWRVRAIVLPELLATRLAEEVGKRNPRQ